MTEQHRGTTLSPGKENNEVVPSQHLQKGHL